MKMRHPDSNLTIEAAGNEANYESQGWVAVATRAPAVEPEPEPEPEKKSTTKK